MTGRIITGDHQIYDLPELLEWTVSYTGGVPCDSYTVQCRYNGEMAEVLHNAAGFLAMEQGAVMLRGTVDEYAVDLSDRGVTLTMTGRGYAARLLDNESRAATYQGATLAEIIRNHVTPYGISCAALAPVTAGSVYTVAAGSSQWKALSDFCRFYGGFTPRFGRDGRLWATPETDSGKRLVIGDETPVLRGTLREDRYGVLTEVLVIDKTRNVSYTVKNQDMLRRGGQCRRVLYTPGQSTYAAMRYTGEYQIEQSKAEEKTVTLTLPGAFAAFPGEELSVDLTRAGLRGTFRVAEAENAFSVAGATTTLTLRERT
ncbi:MAG: hypothetical protein RR350_03325 [Oscillibacter sp.]